MAKVKPEENAFKKVFGRDPKRDEALALKSEAIEKLWQRPTCFPGESEELREERLLLSSPAMGEITDLVTHFKKVFPEFKGVIGINVLFELYKRFCMDEDTEAESETEADVDNAEQKESSPMQESEQKSVKSDEPVQEETVPEDNNRMKDVPTSSEINKNLQEVNTMGNNKSLEELKKIEEEQKAAIENAGNGTVSDEQRENLPKGSDYKNLLSAASNAINQNQEQRVAYTEAAVVQNIILAKKASIEIAKGGAKAVGRLSDPKAAYDAFVQKTGLHIDEETQQPVFDTTKFPQDPENVARVKAMYEFIKSAMADKMVTTPAYVTSNPGSIKGYAFVPPEGGQATPQLPETITNIIISKAALQLKTAQPGSVLKLTAARKNNKNAKNSAKKKSTKKNSFQGVASIKIIGRKEAVARIGIYYKDFKEDAKYEELPGLKSEMYIDYFRTVKDDTSGEPKKGKWRLPLLVEQKKLEVVPGMEIFNSSRTDDKIYDFSVPADKEAALSALSEITAEILAADVKGIENQFLESISSAVAESKAQSIKEQQSEMEGGDEL